MTRIVWDQTSDRVYENGISQGVLYGSNGAGVPWNGLTSVEQTTVDEVEPLYFDGVVYHNLVTLGDFQGVLRAFTYPEEFFPYDGILEVQDGMYLTGQPKSTFGLSYRTEIGTPAGPSSDYKIHILYNLTAIPAQRTHQTLGMDAEPMEFEWEIRSQPENVDHFRNTGYVMIDSRKMVTDALPDLEDLIYGWASGEPTLPDLNTLIHYVSVA